MEKSETIVLTAEELLEAFVAYESLPEEYRIGVVMCCKMLLAQEELQKDKENQELQERQEVKNQYESNKKAESKIKKEILVQQTSVPVCGMRNNWMGYNRCYLYIVAYKVVRV